jgi:succinate dehydrogenase hydrophobic anchor subunit
LWLLFLLIVFSITAGITYGVLRRDWAGAFALGSFIVACLALLLALYSAHTYFGLEKLIDDDIGFNRSGMYLSHELGRLLPSLEEARAVNKPS